MELDDENVIFGMNISKPSLQKIHPTVFDDAIEIDIDAHIYRDKKTNSKYSVSVTELKSKFSAPFEKKVIISNMFRSTRSGNRLKTKDGNSKYEGMTRKDIEDAWESDNIFGTMFHLASEGYLNILSRVDVTWDLLTPDVKQKMFVHFLRKRYGAGNVPVHTPPLEAVGAMCTRFTNFVEKNLFEKGWVPFRTEMIVGMEFDGFSVAGMVDAIFYRPSMVQGGQDEFMLVDWKSQNVHPETSRMQFYFPILDLGYAKTKMTGFCLQLNIYAYILKKRGGIPMKTMSLCVFVTEKKKDGVTTADVLLPIAYDETLVETILATYSSFAQRKKFIETWENPDFDLPFLSAPSDEKE